MAKRGGFPMGGIPGNMGNMMKQMQRLQRQVEEKQQELAEKEFCAQAGGGAVSVVLDGYKNLKSIKILPDACDPEDTETLEEMILAAFQQAAAEAEKERDILSGKTLPGVGF